MNKNGILAGILMAPEADIPAFVAAAFSQYLSAGTYGVSDLLRATIDHLTNNDDADLAEELRTHLEDWT